MKTNYKYIVACLLFQLSLQAQYRFIINNNDFAVITNSAYIVIDNANTNGITTINGGNIISEGEYNVVKWNMNTQTGNYIVPFTTNSLVKIPLSVNITTAGIGSNSSIIFSTYEASTDLNTSYPSDVTNMIDSNCTMTNALFAVDRFWRIDATNYITKPSPSIEFTYNDANNEIAGSNTISESNLKAERFNSLSNSWGNSTKLYGTSNAVVNSVSGVNILPNDFFKSWTLIDSAKQPSIQLLNTSGCALENTAIITVSVSNGTPLYTFNWSNGSTSDIVTHVGMGLLTATITDANNCIQNYSVDVAYNEECSEIKIPNFFTPGNNDGKNDFFVINGLERFPNNSLKIYNRWGSLVYEKKEYKNDWDGRANVSNTMGVGFLPASTYFIVLDFGNNTNKLYYGYLELKY